MDNRILITIIVFLTIIISIFILYHCNNYYNKNTEKFSPTLIGQNSSILDNNGKEIGVASRYDTDIPDQRLIIKAVVNLPGKDYSLYYVINNKPIENKINNSFIKYIDNEKFILEYKTDVSTWEPIKLFIKNDAINIIVASASFV